MNVKSRGGVKVTSSRLHLHLPLAGACVSLRDCPQRCLPPLSCAMYLEPCRGARRAEAFLGEVDCGHRKSWRGRISSVQNECGGGGRGVRWVPTVADVFS